MSDITERLREIANYLHSRGHTMNYRQLVDIFAEVKAITAGLEADLREERDRVARMRVEHGDEVRDLLARARHAEDCLDAAKARIAELETRT